MLKRAENVKLTILEAMVKGYHKCQLSTMVLAFYCHHRWPRLFGSLLDFEFTGEGMKLHKICPKLQFFFLAMCMTG